MVSESHAPPPRAVNFVLPGAMLAFLALLGYLAINPTLESSRPQPSDAPFEDPPSPPGLVASYSRLWEDPLEAAYKDSRERAKEAKQDYSRPENLVNIQSQIQELVLGGLKVPHAGVAEGETRYHIMAVLLPGEPHAESSENRRRIRYAITSGLGVAGYHLAFPDRITYVHIPIYVKAVEKEGVPVDLRVPIKLYRTTELHTHEDPPDASRVLVLWIDESQLGRRPLTSVCDVLSKVFGAEELKRDRSRLQFSVIGPTSSDTLAAMGLEVDSWKDATLATPPLNVEFWPSKTMTVYTYRATVGGSELQDEIFDTTSMEESVRLIPGGFGSLASAPQLQSADRKVPRFVRTIGTDRQLVGELFRELRLRQALPEHDDDGRHIVILTERDTLYGRGLRGLFRFEEATTKLPEFGIHQSNLHLFTYLRGIDGQTVSKNETPKESERARTQNALNFETELPTGPSQYDYIRRVAQQVVQLQTRLRRTGQGRISAVGVMGSDVYDKLLIMRALRQRLANAVYFTTDLDAALSHASEYESTHNLVVASHFGRQLHPSLQREAPVFRDSYQTSCFLSTLMAVGDSVASELFVTEARNDPWRLSSQLSGADASDFLSPLVFEISRTGPYQLTSTGGPWQSKAWYEQLRKKTERESTLAGLVHPPGDRHVRAITGRGFLSALISLLIIFVCLGANLSPVRRLLSSLGRAVVELVKRQPKPIDWILVLSVLAGIALLAVILVDGQRSNGEPITLVGGVSIWPTVILRAIAMTLAGYFAYKSVRSVREREEQLQGEFKLGDPPPTDVPENGNKPSLVARIFQVAVHPGEWNNLLPDWVFRGCESPDEPIVEKWKRLRRTTQLENVIARVTPQIVLFVLFAYYLSPLGDPRSRPIRGDVANVTEWIVFLGSLFGIIILTFVVLDLTQCCRYFAKSIRKARKIQWPSEYINEQARSSNTPAELIGYRATIESLALLSKTYSKLIIYPSIVLVCLILAHLSVFDNWTLPWPLMVLILLCILAAIYGNFSLRNEVRKARETVLRILRRDRFDATQTATSKGLQQYDQVIDQIAAERGGAFRPLTEDPLIQAISLPFGGVGGAVLLEQAFRSIG